MNGLCSKMIMVSLNDVRDVNFVLFSYGRLLVFVLILLVNISAQFFFRTARRDHTRNCNGLCNSVQFHKSVLFPGRNSCVVPQMISK